MRSVILETVLGMVVILFNPDGVGTTIIPFFHVSSPGVSANRAPSPIIYCVVWAPFLRWRN